MKILTLKSENIKRLHAVEITPTGNLVEITGKNAQGKSSVLDSIWWALQGKDSIQTTPIHHGKDKASIILDMGEIVITRRFNSKDDGSYTTSLKVEAADGSGYTSPQKMLDELLGNLTFDPLNFTKIKPKEQLEMLKSFVPDIDFEAIDQENQKDYDERTEINRVKHSAFTRSNEIEVPIERPEEVDIQDLNDQLRNIEVNNQSSVLRAEGRAAKAQHIQDTINQMTERVSRVQDLRHQAAALDEEISGLKHHAEEAQKKLDDAPGLPEVVDTTEIKTKLDDAAELNKAVERWDEKARLIKEGNYSLARSDELTKAIIARNENTKVKIKATKMPVDNLSFGDECILLNELPFDQASDAEQLKTSIMIAIAMNPKLRVIRVRDGSLLDDGSMALMAAIAKEHDYQIWIERVDNTGKIGFVIEDGSLKS